MSRKEIFWLFLAGKSNCPPSDLKFLSLTDWLTSFICSLTHHQTHFNQTGQNQNSSGLSPQSPLVRSKSIKIKIFCLYTLMMSDTFCPLLMCVLLPGVTVLVRAAVNRLCSVNHLCSVKYLCSVNHLCSESSVFTLTLRVQSSLRSTRLHWEAGWLSCSDHGAPVVFWYTSCTFKKYNTASKQKKKHKMSPYSLFGCFSVLNEVCFICSAECCNCVLL